MSNTNTLFDWVVRDAIADAGLDPEALRTDYSGRGMNGRECVGVVGTMPELFRFGVHLAGDARGWQ